MIIIHNPLEEQPENICFSGLSALLNRPVPELMDQLLFFDIETTGFSVKNTICYLIGAVFHRNNLWQYIQWFACTPEEEPEILNAFLSFLKDFQYLIHFNGDGFDIPYLTGRFGQLGIPGSFDGVTSIDLFKHAKNVKNLLKLENYKQKTLEHFLGLSRADSYGGGDLIRVYQQYTADTLLNNNTDNLKDAQDCLLLHNHDDICALPRLSLLLGYTAIADTAFCCRQIQIQDAKDYSGIPVREVFFTLQLPAPIPISVSYGKEPFYLKAFDDTLKLRVRMHTGELKYFYPNYRDYYYLPKEDRSIHKSVAFYVDKNFRTQAKAANCYSKKTGMFLPQLSENETPYFKIDYHDTITYFEAEEAFFNDHTRVHAYLSHIISWLLR